MDYDVTIVGSGFAGLTAGALLSKNGYKVLVIEKHDKPGGYATEFSRSGFRFEVAIHALEGFSSTNLRCRVFKMLDVEKNVNFTHVPNLCKIFGNKENYTLPTNIEEYKEALHIRFPQERKAIDYFFKKMRDVFMESSQAIEGKLKCDPQNPMFAVHYPTLAELKNISVSDFLNSITNNDKFRWSLVPNMGFFHHDVSRFPIISFFISQFHYLNGGLICASDGTQKICEHYVNIIEDAGGKLLLKHEVENVESHSDGVLIKFRKVLGDKSLHEVKSRYSIINAPVPYARKNLLNEDQDSPYVSKTERVSVSTTSLYMGLKKPLKEIVDVDYLNFFSKSLGTDGDKSSGFQFSLIDSSFIRDQSRYKPTACLVTLDSFEKWERAFKEGTYEDEKFRKSEALFEKIKLISPEIEKHIDVFELGTPLTMKKYTYSPRGAAYAYDTASIAIEILMRRQSVLFEPRWHKDPRVLFASTWSSLANGLTGANLAGYQAATTILREASIDIGFLKEYS